MTEFKLYSFADGSIGSIDVDETTFGVRAPRRVLREAILMYQANQRAGTHDTQDRGDVTATIKKPWKQKGTGRARSGRRNSPVWVGGSVAHGPHPRDYSYGVPRKALRVATRSALAARFLAGDVVFVDDIALDTPSTARVAKMLQAVEADRTALIVVADYDKNAWRSTRNIAGASMLPADEVNAYAILAARKLVITPAAFERLKERVAPKAAAAVGGDN